MNPGDWQSDLTRLGRKGGSPEIRRLLREYHEKGGWLGRLARSGHFRLYCVATRRTVTVSHTADDPRSVLNTRAQLKRAEAGR